MGFKEEIINRLVSRAATRHAALAKERYTTWREIESSPRAVIELQERQAYLARL